MAEKLKKKPVLSFMIKRWNGQADSGARTPTSPLVSTPQFKQTVPCVSRTDREKPRKLSAGGISELVQCSLCLDVLHNPKMLPCQHTFCMACLTVYIADLPVIECPMCQTKIQVPDSNFVNNLPSNLYIDSLLQIVGINGEALSPPSTPTTLVPEPSGAQHPTPGTIGAQSVDLFPSGVRCSHCKTLCDNSDTTACEHCKLNFCRLCWSQHLEDLRTQIGSILKQLDSASGRLEHKMEYYKDRCERITEQINLAADEKVNAILEARNNLLQEASKLQKNGDMSALAVKTSLVDARAVASRAMTYDAGINEKQQVSTFINLHQNALQILSDVSKFDVDSFVFDKENFCIEQDNAAPTEAESDDPFPECGKQNEPLESEESLVQHYRSRNFLPHYVWRKASRPGGVAIGPWNNHLYVCGMDSHCVMVVERSQAKIVARLTCEEMLCPVHIAFMKSTGEIYVTDKWKHCVHVFSKEGSFVRSVGHKGSKQGMFRSPEGIAADNANNLIYVVDTGNDRVQILTPEGKFVDQIGVATRLQPTHTGSVWQSAEVTCTELNAPTGVALTHDRVLVLDSGNRRVKVYNKQDKNKIAEFGALGQRKGQFRQPEVIAVDPMGLILVGDSGNCRVQVFKPNGQLVRVFGRVGTDPGQFGWISGMFVTKQLDIIVSDSKNRNVSFF